MKSTHSLIAALWFWMFAMACAAAIIVLASGCASGRPYDYPGSKAVQVVESAPGPIVATTNSPPPMPPPVSPEVHKRILKERQRLANKYRSPAHHPSMQPGNTNAFIGPRIP